MPNIGPRLKQIRERKGLSLRALAKLAHVSHSFIADIEAGRSKPSIDTLQSLAKALGVSLNELVDINDLPDDPPSDIELEELLKHSNIKFNGEPLDEEDKQDIIEFLKVAWKTIRKKRKEG